VSDERVSDDALHYYVTMRHPDDEGARMARELLALRALLKEVALEHRINTEPVKCWLCGVDVPPFKGSIIGPNCRKCRERMESHGADYD
jgi:hypothetical protein